MCLRAARDDDIAFVCGRTVGDGDVLFGWLQYVRDSRHVNGKNVLCDLIDDVTKVIRANEPCHVCELRCILRAIDVSAQNCILHCGDVVIARRVHRPPSALASNSPFADEQVLKCIHVRL